MAIRAFLAVLLVFAVAFAANLSQSGRRNDTIRIIGGVDAEGGEFPYLASLQMRTRKGMQHFCGGSLLDTTTVLTASHCVRAVSRYRVADVRVRIGGLSKSSGGTLLRAKSLIAHPDYVHSHPEYGNDVGIIKLSDSVSDSGSFKFAVLFQNGLRLRAGTTLTTAGCGQTSPSVYGSERLRKVDLPLVKRSDCEAAYHKIDEETGHGYSLPDKIGETLLCAGYTEKTAFVNDRDSCAGDSGGPIMHTASGAVVGVVSLGMPPCGKDGAPGVYANVRGLREFIEEHMG